MAGIVFNIQKFSLNDGPGIRTVVFLKGCPLRCKWCANPESQSFDEHIPWGGEGDIPGEQAKRMEVREVLDVCLQDVDFYEESGGGVTLSGGEPLSQLDFTLALLKELKAKNIHTALETTGYAAEEAFALVLPYVDLFLFDIKHWNGQKHKEGTGVSNHRILQNMKTAVAAGKETLPRLPVIPGYNASIEDANGFVERLRDVGVEKVQLLPFHQFGEGKYQKLGKEYAYAGVPPLHAEDLAGFQKAFLDQGINAFF